MMIEKNNTQTLHLILNGLHHSNETSDGINLFVLLRSTYVRIYTMQMKLKLAGESEKTTIANKSLLK